MSRLATRWLGVGLASCLAVVTLTLTLTGRLALYINPDSTWFAAGMSVVVLIGAVLSFLLPLGAEADHGHDHGGPAHAEPPALRRRIDAKSEDSSEIVRHPAHPPTLARSLGLAATVTGGVAASAVVLFILVLPPASLSAQLAMSRDVGAPPLFAGADAVALASTGDTSSFGIGAWASAFATSTNPDAFDGDTVTLTGFVTPSTSGGGFALTRLVITHCVIDAQTASVPVAADGSAPETGQWVTVSGTVRSNADGKLEIAPTSIAPIPEPQDPYEY
ncbi:TIGR03943 family protein [Microbacterium rhizomatis]|uniref:TIGR03943 family protein n=2 Tax=Microbacterium rhizomatis TaxID=1631477 RepID=A0A5J5J1K4_9MICO|nr:TIGR03943 family protein [Microbacterium rhizomatis]